MLETTPNLQCQADTRKKIGLPLDYFFSPLATQDVLHCTLKNADRTCI